MIKWRLYQINIEMLPSNLRPMQQLVARLTKNTLLELSSGKLGDIITILHVLHQWIGQVHNGQIGHPRNFELLGLILGISSAWKVYPSTWWTFGF